MGGLRSAFSFYGSKSRVLDFYPAPRHGLIVEPFAGGATYSLRHGEGRDVWINDLDPKVFAMWKFIQSAECPEWAERLPGELPSGTIISERFSDVPAGLMSILQAEANQGTQGSRGVHDQVTSMGAKCWPRLRRKLEWAHARCQGWTITNLPYAQVNPAPWPPSTWFIDPPYDNTAGRRYREQVVDYGALAQWCLSRRGQTIVCENVGATWLPFEPLVERRGIRSRYQRSTASEAIWTMER
jgi:site-specific DNA-adenine methylase